MTSDHSIPRCLRCPDTALRLIDRGAFAVSRDAAPLPAEKLRRMAADPQLTVEERSAAGRILARRDS